MAPLSLRKGVEINTVEGREPIRVHVGCSIVYESLYPTPMLLAISPGYNHCLIEEQRMIYPEVPIHEYIDGFGNQIWRLIAPVGTLHVKYDAIAEYHRCLI